MGVYNTVSSTFIESSTIASFVAGSIIDNNDLVYVSSIDSTQFLTYSNYFDAIYGMNDWSNASVSGVYLNTYSSIYIMHISNGVTAQSLSISNSNLPGQNMIIHFIIDNSNNNSNLTITIPHGTSNNKTYINMNDMASGSMTVTHNTYAEINLIVANYSNKIYIRYINS